MFSKRRGTLKFYILLKSQNAVQSIIESSQMIPFVTEIWHNVDDMLISVEDISMKSTKLDKNFTQFQHAVNVGTSRDILLLVISGQNV